MNARRLENALLSILVGVASFMATYLKDMAVSISKLNEQMATIIERTTQNTSTLSLHDTRLRRLEDKR